MARSPKPARIILFPNGGRDWPRLQHIPETSNFANNSRYLELADELLGNNLIIPAKKPA